LDFGHRNLEDSSNAAVQEDFELVKLGLAQGPCFGVIVFCVVARDRELILPIL
jgi:hypothetical protein